MLRKNFGAFEVFAISIGTMVGAGIFVLPGLVAERVGGLCFLPFVVSGVVALCAALSVSELAAAMPSSGGSYFFISRAMGGLLGSIVGWGSIIALVFDGSFVFVAAGEYFNELVPINPTIVAALLCVLIAAVNIVSTKITGKLENALVMVKMSLLVLFVIAGLFFIKTGHFKPLFTGSTSSFLGATGMIFITYLGLAKASAVAEEVRNPARDLPLGIISSVVSVVILYTLVLVVTNGILSVDVLAGSVTPISDAARVIAGQAGVTLAVFAGLASASSSGNAAVLSASRYPFAMARDNLMPRKLIKINDRLNTPIRSIILVSALMILLIIVLDVEKIAELGSAANMLILALLNASVIILRRSRPEWYTPGFRSPLFPYVQIFGLLGSIALLPFMGIASIICAGIILFFGIAWFYLFGRGRVRPAYGVARMLKRTAEGRAVQNDRYSESREDT